MLEALLAAGANPALSSADGTPPLLMAAGATNESLVTVQTLLAAGVVVHGTDKDGWTALMAAAAEQEAVATVEALLAAGAEVDMVAKYGETALVAAAGNWYDDKGLATVKVLLAANANVNGVNASCTPLERCYHSESITKALQAAGAVEPYSSLDCGHTSKRFSVYARSCDNNYSYLPSGKVSTPAVGLASLRGAQSSLDPRPLGRRATGCRPGPLSTTGSPSQCAWKMAVSFPP